MSGDPQRVLSVGSMKPALFTALFVAGCAAQPVSLFTTIPKDTANECIRICDSIGLHMTSVVVVASQVGCVCEPTPGAGSKPGQASATSAGAVIALEAQRQQEQARQQQIHSASPTPNH